MNLPGLLKLAKGGWNPAQMGELLRSFGIELTMTPVPEGRAGVTFQGLAHRAIAKDARLFELQAKLKSGDEIRAIVVVTGSESLSLSHKGVSTITDGIRKAA